MVPGSRRAPTHRSPTGMALPVPIFMSNRPEPLEVPLGPTSPSSVCAIFTSPPARTMTRSPGLTLIVAAVQSSLRTSTETASWGMLEHTCAHPANRQPHRTPSAANQGPNLIVCPPVCIDSVTVSTQPRVVGRDAAQTGHPGCAQLHHLDVAQMFGHHLPHGWPVLGVVVHRRPARHLVATIGR